MAKSRSNTVIDTVNLFKYLFQNVQTCIYQRSLPSPLDNSIIYTESTVCNLKVFCTLSATLSQHFRSNLSRYSSLSSPIKLIWLYPVCEYYKSLWIVRFFPNIFQNNGNAWNVHSQSAENKFILKLPTLYFFRFNIFSSVVFFTHLY